MEKTKRELLPDLIKGFAIFMVVLGHCIQETNGMTYSLNRSFYDNKLYQFIYSFHMPLFMLVAGYFSFGSMRRATDAGKKAKCIGSKMLSCLLPVVFWTAFEFVVNYVKILNLNQKPLKISTYLKMFPKACYENLWFLWAVLICFCVVFLIHFLLKDNIFVYAAIYIAMFFLPDTNNMNVYEYMFPFFAIGFYYKKNFEKIKSSRIYSWITANMWKSLGISFALFMALFLIYNNKVFIYVSGYRYSNANPVKMIAVDVYRMIIGMAGSLFFILLLKKISDSFSKCKFLILSYLGRYSMGIYIIQTYFILFWLKEITNNCTYSLLRTILFSILATLLSFVSAFLIALVPYLRRIIGQK